ncbi:MAG: hypothetical protein J6Q30_02935 [Oscillospiraceae bacterium]|nr:hypothetical protein [Oscillospiraceae bacterium]
MPECTHSCGSCGHCGKCGSCLTLNEAELHLLQKLGEIPFLPVARRADSADPIYLEDQNYPVAEYSLILQSLEAKGLITLDYDIPIKDLQSQSYSSYPIVGSFALSARGQHVLELLDLQGIQ